jgi:Spy/CpxP family protein refolding chaperone
MIRSLTPWLLGGALCASLTWNWRLTRAENTSEPEGCSALDLAPLELASEQEQALDALCERSCHDADRLAQRADERERELLRALAAGEFERAELEPRVLEITELRRESLSACVEGLLAVRAVLTPAQVESLLQQCEGGECR